MLGLRPPGFEFLILFMEAMSSHHPQECLLAQFSLYVHKSGLKPDSFHFILTAGTETSLGRNSVLLDLSVDCPVACESYMKFQ